MNLSVTGIIKNFHCFDREFWLSYKALEAIMDPNEFKNIKITLLKSKKVNPKIINLVGEEIFNLKREEIDQEWKLKSDQAKETGISVHEKLHTLLTTDLGECRRSFNIPTDKYKIAITEQFMESDGLFPEFRIELNLDKDITLIGVADLIIKDENHITIIDYKTDEKIETTSRYDTAKNKKKCMKYPLTKLPDCNLSHYSIQLSLYAWMLQQLNPNLIIDGLKIVHIKDGKLKREYQVEYLKDTVDSLIKWYIKSLKLKVKTDGCKERKY